MRMRLPYSRNGDLEFTGWMQKVRVMPRCHTCAGIPSSACLEAVREWLDAARQEHGHAKRDHGEVVCGSLFVAGGDSAILLEPADQPLDFVALVVGGFVEIEL